MVSLRLPSENEIHAFLKALTERNPGLGVVDTWTGQIYLASAGALAGGDHASLVEHALGILDIDRARHLRGFVVGKSGDEFLILNLSGLNPVRNEMEPDLFEAVFDGLMPLIRQVRRE